MLIGMVHLLPLPGSPYFNEDIDLIEQRALQDALTLQKAGFDGLIIENYGDQPFLINKIPLEGLIAMARIISRITKEINLKVGINIEFNVWEKELIMAKVMNADFIRVEVFSEFRFHPSGIVWPSISEILRLRKNLKAESIKIFADFNVKNTFPILNINDESSLKIIDKYADAIVYTGSKTGEAPNIDEILQIKERIEKPLYIGSGVNENNIKSFLNIADGVIVGTSIKKENKTSNPVSFEKAKRLVEIIKQN
jgi:hypothetical protein